MSTENFNKIEELLSRLTSGCSVSGHEARLKETVAQIADKYFDSMHTDSIGNYVLLKKCGAKNPKKILIDAHIDEVGMLVREVLDGGFLRIINVGGIDTRILPASEVTIYGEKELYGVVCATPPHLQDKETRKALPKITEMLIDTGLDRDEALKTAPPGTPVGYRTKITKLLNGKLCGRGFDDKICACAAILSALLASEAGAQADIAVLLSAKEEIGHFGAITGAYTEAPDCAIVIDVGSAAVPDSERRHKIYLGKGPEISLSCITDIKFTKKMIAYAKEHDIPHQLVAEAQSTGTNANNIPLTRRGIPTALISVPLNNMHTAVEVISLYDVENTARLISGFISSLACGQEEVRHEH